LEASGLAVNAARFRRHLRVVGLLAKTDLQRLDPGRSRRCSY